MPLKKVTTRSPLSISRPVRKPGATLVWTWPKSRSAAHTFSTGTLSGSSRRLVAMFKSPRGLIHCLKEGGRPVWRFSDAVASAKRTWRGYDDFPDAGARGPHSVDFRCGRCAGHSQGAVAGGSGLLLGSTEAVVRSNQ